MALACHCSRQAWAHAFARPSTVPIAPFVHVKHKYTLNAILGSGSYDSDIKNMRISTRTTLTIV